MLAGEDNGSTTENIDSTSRDHDENFTTVASFQGDQTRISLNHLGRTVAREFLEARNIADALEELLNKIKDMLQEISTSPHKREQDSSLSAISRELMKQANLLRQQLFKKGVF
jgi:hypothetical protein